MIVPLTQHLFELIARDAAELEKVLPVGVKFGINIAPDHLHSESFKADIQKLLTSCPLTISRLCWKLPSAIC